MINTELFLELKKDTDAFGKAVTAKLGSVEAGVAPGIISTIDGYFNDAIVAYGGKGKSFKPMQHLI